MNKCRPRIILISILFKKYALKLVSFYIASVCYSAKSPLVIFQAESYLVCYPKFYLSSSLVNVYLHLNNLFGPPKKELNILLVKFISITDYTCNLFILIAI